MTELAAWRFLRPYLKWDPLFYALPQGRRYRRNLQYLHGFSDKVINIKRQQLAAGKPHYAVIEGSDSENSSTKEELSFLDLVLEAVDDPNLVSHADMQSLVHTFLFAVNTI